MPPRRSASGSAGRKRDAPDLFRGSSPDEGKSAGEAMVVDTEENVSQADEPMAATTSSSPRSHKERREREDKEAHLEGEGVNMPSGIGHGVPDGEAQESTEPVAAAVPIKSQDIDFSDAITNANGSKSKLVPETAEGVPAGEASASESQNSHTQRENYGHAFAKSDVDSTAEVNGSSSGLLASLPVFYSKSLPSTSKLQIFQYPTYPRARQLPIPDSARQRGLSPAMRYRPRSKRVEVELPLDLRPSVYDLGKGEEYAHGAAAGESIGPGGGRSAKSSSSSSALSGKSEVKREYGIHEVGSASGSGAPQTRQRLEKTRLESVQIPHQTKYLIGVIRDGAMHLTPVDSIHQLRPSMHYLDNLDMLEHKNRRNAAAAAEGDDEAGDAAADAQARQRPAPRTQNLNVSVRTAGESSSSTSNAAGGSRSGVKPLEGRDALMAAEREAESEAWVDLEWKDEHTDESQKAFDGQMFASSKTRLECLTRPREFLPRMT